MSTDELQRSTKDLISFFNKRIKNLAFGTNRAEMNENIIKINEITSTVTEKVNKAKVCLLKN